MAELAIDWCDFLESHARKVYAGILRKDLQAAHALARKIRQGAITEGQSPREVYRNSWALLRTPDDVYGGLTQLETYGWVRVTEHPARTQGGRPRETIHLHPALRTATTAGPQAPHESQEDHA